MRHPDDMQLNAYLDGELRDDASQSFQAHLRACQACQARLAEWKRLSKRIYETRPALTAFRPEGEFWAGLAAKLPQARRETWPLLEYLPPFLLATLGALLRLLISLISTAYDLTILGVLPRLGPLMSQHLANILSPPLLGQSLGAWINQSSQQAARSWGALSPVGQETVLFGVLWVALMSFLGIVVAFYGLWATCQHGADRSDQNGGH